MRARSMRRFLAWGSVLGTALVLVLPAAAHAQYGGDTGAVTIGNSKPKPGGTVQFTLVAGTFQPDSLLVTFLLSEPVQVGTFTVDAAGGSTGSVTIPADTAPGAHTLEFRGTGPDGQPKVVSAALDVGGTGLAGTGPSNTGDVLRTAGIVFVVGLVLLAIAAQRRRARAAKSRA